MEKGEGGTTERWVVVEVVVVVAAVAVEGLVRGRERDKISRTQKFHAQQKQTPWGGRVVGGLGRWSKAAPAGSRRAG